MVELPVELGTGECRSIRILQFVVLDVESPYNAFLGRPALAEFRAIIAPWCLTLKFPTVNGVGVVQGDQVDLRTIIHRNRVARLHNAKDRLKTFELGKLVAKKGHPALPPLRSAWSGSRKIKQKLKDGEFELSPVDGLTSPRAWNSESLHRYYN